MFEILYNRELWPGSGLPEDFEPRRSAFLMETLPGAPSPCPLAGRCGGCQLPNMDYSRQLRWKQGKVDKLLSPFCRPLPILGMEHPYHYRNKVQAAFGLNRNRRIISGVYQSSSGRIAATDRCLLEDPRADRIVVSIRKLMEQQRILPYDPRTGRGFLRHVLVRVGAETGQVMVVLVAATPVFPQKKYFLPALLERHPEITTLVLNINPDYDGLMLGERETALYGPGYILDRLCGCDFGVSPRSFYQVNSIQTRALYETAMEYAGLTGRELAVDAYCGTGTIGLIASRHARQVIGVESNREAVRDAIANAKRNGIENAWFACEDAGRFLTRMEQEGQRPDLLFLDPPRGGCSRQTLEAAAGLEPGRMVMISCNPETLARDLKLLCVRGYRVEKAQPVDLFPHTSHVECVALMTKKGTNKQ